MPRRHSVLELYMQGDAGWDLLGALDHLKRHAGETQNERTLTAAAFLEKRVQKVGMHCLHMNMECHREAAGVMLGHNMR